MTGVMDATGAVAALRPDQAAGLGLMKEPLSRAALNRIIEDEAYRDIMARLGQRGYLRQSVSRIALAAGGAV